MGPVQKDLLFCIMAQALQSSSPPAFVSTSHTSSRMRKLSHSSRGFFTFNASTNISSSPVAFFNGANLTALDIAHTASWFMLNSVIIELQPLFGSVTMCVVESDRTSRSLCTALSDVFRLSSARSSPAPACLFSLLKDSMALFLCLSLFFAPCA